MLIPGKKAAWRISTPTAIAVCLLFGIGILSAFYVYNQIDRSGRINILERVSTMAAAVSEDQVTQLTGTEIDLGTPSYEELKLFLVRMRSVNHDARFLYVIGERPNGELFFFADSESAESPDYSPPGQTYEEATPAMYTFFENGEPISEGPDRDRWGIWISGYAPVTDGSGKVIAMLGMDVPASRHIQDALAYALLPLFLSLLLITALLALEQMRRREREYIEQKAEFLSIASHEIRTPLTGIRWAIESLLKRENPPIDPKTRAVLALMHESSLALIARVNNLLDLTKLEEKNMAKHRIEEISIPSFLEDIADSLALSAQQRAVSIVLDDSIARAGSFMADAQMMHHAFFNLITNGIKYTREGTAVTLSYENTNNMHVFRVADKGEGIPVSEQERIFAGYYRTKEAVASGQFGSGLGLYLAKKAAELHGGTIRVNSTPGEGAIFIISIPEIPTLG